MIDMTISCDHWRSNSGPSRLLAGAARLRRRLRAVGHRLLYSWREALSGQPIAELDMRLPRDIGLSECAAARAVACTSSLGMTDHFPIGGLGPYWLPRQLPDRLCAHACPPNGLCQCQAGHAEPNL